MTATSDEEDIDMAEERFVEELGNGESEITNICKEVKEMIGHTDSLGNVESLFRDGGSEEAEEPTATIPDHQTVDYEFDDANCDDDIDYESESEITNNEMPALGRTGHNEIVMDPLGKDSNDNELEHKKYEFVDTTSLSLKVRHYLKANQIQWERFASLVLGISQSRLSTLLGRARPWHLLTRRVQALYERMQLWMDTRATFGNNPYAREKAKSKEKGKQGSGCGKKKKPRSLLDLEENVTLRSEVLENNANIEKLVDKSMGYSAKVMVNEDNSLVTLNEDPVEKDININADAIRIKKEFEETHLPNHADDVSWCEVCDLASASSQAFGEHVLSIHLTVEGLCDICGGSSDDFVEHFKLHLRREDAAASPLPAVDVKEECKEQNQEEISTQELYAEGRLSLNPFFED